MVSSLHFPGLHDMKFSSDQRKKFRWQINSITVSVKDCDILQQDLGSSKTCSYVSNVKFNASRCKVLTVARKKSPVTHEYHLGNTYLKRVLEEKDLGIIISRNLSYDSHVMHIALKANRMLGLLKRTCPLITDVKSQADTLSLSSEVTTLLCYRCVVSRKCQIENDRRKSPEVCNSPDTQN